MKSSIAMTLRWVGLIGMLAIAVMRCAIFFVPQVAFDLDPAFDVAPLAGLAPAGSLILDVLLLLACAIALLGEIRSGRGIDWFIMALALIPWPIVLWHGSSDAGDLWRGSTWAAAATACATAAHLARDRSMRIVLISILLATIAPVLARGIVQITHEHAGMMDFFRQNKEQILREHGWPVDSSSARIYERRLEQPQPIGWFATSNIFASMMAFGVVLCAGLGLAAARARLQSGWAGAMALAALAATAGLWLSGSKGAALAAIAGLAVLAILDIGFHKFKSTIAPRFAGALVISLVFFALAGVAVRGALLPEGFLGDKSLLFRWHYMIASAHIVADAPIPGVGPDGYQAAYTLHRVPRNPEEVTIAHSMFWDWICTLGISGAAWIALVLLLLWRVGKSDAPTENIASSTDASAMRRACRSACAVVAFGLIPAAIIEWPALDGIGLVARLLGAAGFLAIAMIAAFIANAGAIRTVLFAAIAAIAALIIHGQIEMTFTQHGAAAWAMMALGSLGGAKVSRHRWAGVPFLIVIPAIAVWLIFQGVAPAMQQQRAMLRAASMLAPIRNQPDDVAIMIQQRQATASALVESYEIWPINVHPLETAAEQLELTATRPNGPQPIGLLMQGIDVIDRAIREHGKSSSMAISIGLNMRLAMLTDDAQYWNRAVALARQMTDRDPNGLSAWRRLGDVLWAAGKRQDAASAYRRALECDTNFELDELKRLSEPERARVQQRIAKAEGVP